MSFHDTTSETQDMIKEISTPVKRSLVVQSSDKEDLSNSFLVSGNSPAVTEDLIINEKIEFFVSESENSNDLASLTYTKTLPDGYSSVFPSFEASNFFLNSATFSRNESFSGKYGEKSAPQPFCLGAKGECLKIPNLDSAILRKMRILVKGGECSVALEEDSQDFIYQKVAEMVMKDNLECDLNDDKKTCGCDSCTII
jgi:hypothetical protein